MLPSKFRRFLILALVLMLSAAVRANESEVHAYYWVLTPDLDAKAPGVRVGWQNIEFTFEKRTSFGASIGLYQNFNKNGNIVPRVAAGVQVIGSGGLLGGLSTTHWLAGMGVTFPFLNLSGGKAGIGWDYYLYISRFAGKTVVQTLIPLTFAYYF